MRKWILGCVTVLALVVLPVAATAEIEAVGVQYASFSSGPAGLLHIQNALGQQFSVTDSAGHMVGAGVVPSNAFTIPVISSGPDANGVVLTVRVGAVTTNLYSEWWIWE